MNFHNKKLNSYSIYNKALILIDFFTISNTIIHGQSVEYKKSQMENFNVYEHTIYCCPCFDCDKEYKSRFNLKRHFEKHHLGKKFNVCSICKKSFASGQILREHLYRHSGIKPYRCSFCRKRFRQYSHLSVHRKIHLVK